MFRMASDLQVTLVVTCHMDILLFDAGELSIQMVAIMALVDVEAGQMYWGVHVPTGGLRTTEDGVEAFEGMA